MNTGWCTNCGDEFDVTEQAPIPLDPDEPRFCSDDCETRWTEAAEAEREYDSGRYGGAPVWP